MQQLLALTLAFGLCAARPLDVRASPSVPTFEEGDACPDVDGFFVASGEITIEACKEEFLDARLSVGVR